MTSHQCLICYEEFPEIEVIHPCPQSEDSHCCIPCFQRYLESKFESTYEGACPILTCVFCKSTSDKKCLISDDQLKQYCPSLYERYLILASSLLSIQCSNCHTRKTVFVSPTFNDTIQSLMPKIHDFDRFMVDLRAYDQGFISIRDFFDQITTTYCPNLLTSVDLKAWTVMRDVLLLVNNSERRANLHLRYIKFRPCVWSPCCNTAMCFRCKTKNYHEGLTCEEVTATQSNELLPCGQCGVALVKGDGCDSIVCVCGNRFSWSEELQRANLSSEFTTLFPHNTPDRCAEILCYPNTDTELFRRAAAWSKMHKEQFEQGLLRWYLSTFGISCSQLCLPIISLENSQSYWQKSTLRLPKNIQNVNTERANTLWKLSHPNEIQQCQLSTSHARQSLFYTLFPLLQDRCLLLAHMEMFEQMKATKSNNWKLLSSVFYPKSFNFTLPKNEPLLRGLDLIDRASILQEAQLWYNDQANQLEVHKMLVKLWIQRINQFICLYGNTKVQLIPCESRNYDYDILYSTCYDSTALTLRTLQKDDRVKLRDAPGNSTVIKVYSDGLVALRHDNGGNGLYKRERIIELTSQTYLPFHGIPSPHLDNFICYLLCLQELLLLPERELINAMSDLVPICPKDIDHSMKVTFIEIIEMLDFMSLSKIDLGSSCITWNDLLFIIHEEGIRRLSSRS